MSSYESLTPQDKARLHRTRYELGKELARRLTERTLNQTHDTIHGREIIDFDTMRRVVWQAESEALRADPQEKFLPPDIKQERGRGIAGS